MTIPLLHVEYGQTGDSIKQNPLGMREMQAKAYAKRDAQYLLLKAPPASGKSRALMFIALDKLTHQDIKKAIITVPEMTIGGSFADTDLKSHGFFADWRVKPENNLCIGTGTDNDKGKIDAFKRFMASTDPILICTHATFRFAFEAINHPAAFNDTLVAIDEFHHVSAAERNRLGAVLDALMAQSSAHIVAMTGSYFRGDAVPILLEQDEDKFEKVTYTYYEQLNGYRYLKSLGLGYHFYQGRYIEALREVLDPNKKTIIHIPNVNSGEAAIDKYTAVDHIIDILGEYDDKNAETGVITITTSVGKTLKIADLVDDRKTANRERTLAYLRDSKERDAIDIIIALGMAKEGFDWPYCEHVLTIGYRSSMTEVVQIIGRSTRDCEGKTHAQFTNLIAQPDAADEDVAISVNNLLKAITLSLLMEQVLAPNITFRRRSDIRHDDTLHKGDIIVDDSTVPVSQKVIKILNQDSDDLIATLLQGENGYDKKCLREDNAVTYFNTIELPQMLAERFNLDAGEAEQVAQGILTKMHIRQNGGLHTGETLPLDAVIEGEKQYGRQSDADAFVDITTLREEERPYITEIFRERELPAGAQIKEGDCLKTVNNQFIKLGEKFINVDRVNIDLIRSVNPFQQSYEIISKNVDAPLLKNIQDYIHAERVQVSEEEAVMLWEDIQTFYRTHKREPNINASDYMEKRLAEVLLYIRRKKAESMGQ